jgi:hypothetical protein
MGRMAVEPAAQRREFACRATFAHRGCLRGADGNVSFPSEGGGWGRGGREGDATRIMGEWRRKKNIFVELADKSVCGQLS